MPLYEYLCPEHGVQEHLLPFREDGPFKERPCNFVLKTLQVPAEPNWLIIKERCKKPSTLQVSAPAIIDVQRDWNEKANEYQRDTYTQAKAQVMNAYNEEAERSGKSPRKVTEAAVQVAAKAIDKRKKVPAPTDAQRHKVALKKNKMVKESG